MIDLNLSVTAPSDRPVFLLSSGHRCGSTLLQRLLNSCPDVLIWGEQNGYLNGFLREYEALLDWESRFSNNRKIFLLEGYDNFVPNMVPEDHELRTAASAHIAALFCVPAMRLGRAIWGFKEVRYGAKVALFLQRCFPKARFIHLTRNIVECFISLKHWEDSSDPWNRKWTEKSLEDWVRINGSFLNFGDKIEKLLTVKYEDVVSDPKGFIAVLSDFLNTSLNSFDQSVFDRKIHYSGPEGQSVRKEILASDLIPEEQSLLLKRDTIEIAQRYGYEISF
jgi:hypothetical protein